MNKQFKSYLVIWAVLLALFNVIVFVGADGLDAELSSESFWIGYGFVTLGFLGQLGCAWRTLKAENLTKLFYNIPLLKVSYSCLFANFIIGSLCMLFSSLPYWVSVILCSIVLAIDIIAMVKAAAAANVVGQLDQKIKVQTFFVKSLTVDAETLMARATTEEIKAECRKVYETIRYSDPMSSDALNAAESQITLKYAALSDAVAAGDLPAVQAAAREVIILMEDRNKKCKLLK